MSIKESYYYLFYKFYKLGDMSISMFSSDFIATIAISWLELIFIGSFQLYYRDFFNPKYHAQLVSFQALFPIIMVVTINYLAFINNTNWKAYFKRFDKFSQEKNDNGTLVVWGIVILIIANFVVSVVLG